eukprot:103425-Pleurochrysis_carterae.AAC.3
MPHGLVKRQWMQEVAGRVECRKLSKLSPIRIYGAIGQLGDSAWCAHSSSVQVANSVQGFNRDEHGAASYLC